MRKLIACLSLGLIVAAADHVSAQQPPKPVRPAARPNQFTAGLSYRPQRPRVRTQKTEADLLIHRAAVAQARQRVARIEARKWTGYSPQRPFMPASRSFYGIDVNALATAPWGWYAAPGWWMTGP